MPLGRSVVLDNDSQVLEAPPLTAVNTRVSLWPTRWPAIALDVCIDKVEEAPPEARAEVKRDLPCKFCPENSRCLVGKHKELGPLLYSRELLTKARSQEASLFPDTLMLPMFDTTRACLPHYLKPAGLEHELIVVSAWDIAWSEKIGGDWLVKITGELNLRTGRKRVIDIRRWQALTYPQQTALIVQQHEIYHDDWVVIEADAAQIIWSQTVEATSNVPVLRHAAGSEKQSMALGVPALLIDFSNQRWTFPYREGCRGYDDIHQLLIELGAFGYLDGKLQGVGEHDDCVMALWHLWYGLRCGEGGIDTFRAGITAGRAQ